VARLIWKELASAKWILLLTAIGTLIALLIGDPLFFRGDAETVLAAWLMIPAFILGLRAYSGELSGDTARFLSSRPVKWWQIWLAKALAGVIATLGILAFAGLVYAVTAPAVYRPFIAEGVRQGFITGLPQVGLAFGFGFVVSVLMPGVALSFAALVAVFVGSSIPFAVIAEIGSKMKSHFLQDFVDDAGQNMFVLGSVAALIACLFVARKLPKLDTRERWMLWLKPMMGAFVLACILGAFGVGLLSSPGGEFAQEIAISPNGRWAVARISEGDKEHSALVDTRSGREVISWRNTQVYAWSPDSSRFAFTMPADSLHVVSVPPNPSVTQIAKLHPPRPSAPEVRSDPPTQAVAWSPSGREIAVIWESYSKGRTIYRAEVISPETKDVRTIKELPWMSYMKPLPTSGDAPIVLTSGMLYWPSERRFSRFDSTNYSGPTSGGG
jgi:hypothetical protein